MLETLTGFTDILSDASDWKKHLHRQCEKITPVSDAASDHVSGWGKEWVLVVDFGILCFFPTFDKLCLLFIYHLLFWLVAKQVVFFFSICITLAVDWISKYKTDHVTQDDQMLCAHWLIWSNKALCLHFSCEMMKQNWSSDDGDGARGQEVGGGGGVVRSVSMGLSSGVFLRTWGLTGGRQSTPPNTGRSSQTLNCLLWKLDFYPPRLGPGFPRSAEALLKKHAALWGLYSVAQTYLSSLGPLDLLGPAAVLCQHQAFPRCLCLSDGQANS